jgi:demethylspheroidene O-methyltransferase
LSKRANLASSFKRSSSYARLIKRVNVPLPFFLSFLNASADARALSQRLSLPQDATDRLLAAAVSLRLVEQRSDGRYGLGVLGAALVGNPGVVAMIEHHALLYADLRDPVALLRGDRDRTELGRYWAYAGNADAAALAPEQVAEYSELMAASQPLVTREILAAYPLHRHRQLLDVGGGDGSFVCAVAAAVPAIRLQLFDLPAVADRATGRFAAAGLTQRAVASGGDFRRDPLPTGADLITLVRVLFDHPDETVLELLGAVRRAIPDDGMLLIPVDGFEADVAIYTIALTALDHDRILAVEDRDDNRAPAATLSWRNANDAKATSAE